jgi:cell division transport system permease protein
MIGRILYFFSKARESMLRTPFLAAATVGMLAVVFMLFNSFSLIALNVSNLAERWIGSVRMTAFLSDSATPEDAQRLAGEFRQLPEVTGAFYVSREEATARFLGHFPGNRSILEGLPDNPLPSSLELTLAPSALQIDKLEALAMKLEADAAVDEAIYGRELFTKLSALIGLVRLVGFLLGLALMVAVLFLTANTIRLNLYSRREEIKIMQLVGATRWFVRWPYLIEGALQGFAGASISVLVVWAVFLLSRESLTAVLSGPLGALSLSFLNPSQVMLIVATGSALGMAGSFVALGRFWRLD